MLHEIQKVVTGGKKEYKTELQAELKKLTKRFSCSESSQQFALRVSERELRLPAPLKSALFDNPNANKADKWWLPAECLDAQAAADQQMQQDVKSRQGVQLVTVTREMPTEAAHLQYPSVAKSPLSLITWAKILDDDKTQYVAHMAVLIDGACNVPLYQALQSLQQPSYKDVAARLDVIVSTGLRHMAQATMSLRLNICQPQDGSRAKVRVNSDYATDRKIS